MKYKKMISSLLAAALMTVLCLTPTAHATIYDVKDAESIEALMRQYKQIERQVQLLETRLHYFQDLRDLKGIYETVTMMLNLQDQSGKLWSVAGLPGDWRSKYPDNEELRKTVLEKERDTTLNHARNLLDDANQAIYDAVEAQGYVISIKNDQIVLEDLLSRSDSEEANLTDAVKLGNHIAAVQIHQLMRLQYLLATGLHMQSLIYAQQVHAAKVNDIVLVEQQFAGLPEENPLKNGPGEYTDVELDSAGE